MNPRWMCDRISTWLKDAAVEEWSHPPWSPRPRNAHEGPWDGLYPAGYKLVRRAPHARKGLALDRNEAQTNEENWVIRQGPIGVTPISKLAAVFGLAVVPSF
jgi:hypothetical protein